MNKKKRLLVIGGGTGTYTVLTGLKVYPQFDLSVIVSMMDDGGSNRVIRDEFGLLPTSDLRQCIVALSEEHPSDLLRKLFTYRYNQGTGISGITFGNLFMAALTDIYGSQKKAIEKTCEFLDVKGLVIPVTFDDSHLVARYENGKQILGEQNIDEPPDELAKYKIVEIEVFPKANPNEAALKAIRKADFILLGPGDLYTSILPNILVDKIPDAIHSSNARVVYTVNLMTKYGQTSGFSASDHLNKLEKYLGKGIVDYCIVNNGKNIPDWVLARYKEEKAEPVIDDIKQNAKLKVLRGDLISGDIYIKPGSDKLKRSLIRHD